MTSPRDQIFDLTYPFCLQGSKCTSGGAPGQPYYTTHQFPAGSSATLPNRGRPPTGSIPARAYSPAVPPVAANKSSGMYNITVEMQAITRRTQQCLRLVFRRFRVKLRSMFYSVSDDLPNVPLVAS